MDADAAAAMTFIEFGPFRFDRQRREVSSDQGPLRLGSRALDILALLLESPGQLFSRDEIVARVWPRTIVEETNLRVHMSALRRALGDGQDGARYIENVPGRGYVFVGAARPSLQPAAAPPGAGSASALTCPIGRESAIAQLDALLLAQRLVTVVGAGGMGKTTVAHAVAERLRARFVDAVHFVDLSRIGSPALVAVELGQALGHNVSPAEPALTLERVLRHRCVLVVMDNCEHVVDAAAQLIDALMRTCPGVRFLATSREPLAVEAEWVYRLPPLGVPPAHEPLGPAALLAYPAVQLFVARARAICAGFEFDAVQAPAVRALCEALDGIPLAIELAAARVDSLGAPGLLKRLGSVLELLTRGRRTARSGHQTLNAVLAWSFGLLSEREKKILLRLSVFRGSFDLDGAVTVADHGDGTRQQVVDEVLSLCSKSLVAPHGSDDGVTLHRLLFVTRLYAERRLAESPDDDECHRRHAAFILEALLRGQRAGLGMSEYQWSPALGSSIADVRAAIDWALVREHDLVLGVRLTAHAMRPYRDVGLVQEYRTLVELAMGKVDRIDDPGGQLELQLRVGAAFMTTYGLDGGRGMRNTFDQTRELAHSSDDAGDRLEALLGMGVAGLGQGDYRRVLALCEEVRVLATGEFQPLSVVVADRLAAMALHALGRHAAAVPLAERVMAPGRPRIGRRFLSEVPVAVSMGALLARIEWLRGDYVQAWQRINEVLARSRQAHFFARAQTLGTAAIQLAVWRGDAALARQWTQELLELSNSKGLPYWEAHAVVYRRIAAGQELGYGSEEYLLMEQCAPLRDYATTMQAAKPSAAMRQRVEEGAIGWCAAEVLRLSALDALRQDEAAVRARGVAQLRQAWALAERQGERFWLLRLALTMTTLGRAGDDWGREPGAALRELVSAAPAGLELPELVAARRLTKIHGDSHPLAAGAVDHSSNA